MLVGDRDREQAARALRRHFVGGRLTIAELGERVDTTLRARSRADLDTALDDLPFTWPDVSTVARRARRSVQRFLALVRMWIKVNAALVVAFAVAVAVGAPIGASLGATAIAWMVASWALWRVWRRG